MPGLPASPKSLKCTVHSMWLARAVLIIAGLSASVASVYGQGSATQLTVLEVSFFGDIPIYKDEIGVSPAPLIQNPVWPSAGKNEPVGYEGGSTMDVAVKFKISPLPAAAQHDV